MSAVEKINIT